MLCQLVCVDRRYQRMNCFNIRELQGILKRKFFPDLMNNSDHHHLMESSMLGLRFKINFNEAIRPDQSLFYNFGITNLSKQKSINLVSYIGNDSAVLQTTHKTNTSIMAYFIDNFFLVKNEQILSLQDNKFLFFLESYLSLMFYEILNLLKVNLTYLFITCKLLPYHAGNILLHNLNLYPQTRINGEGIVSTLGMFNGRKLNNFKYYSDNLNNQTDSLNKVNNFSDMSNSVRFNKFNNVLIGYDYKSGHYLSIWDQLYPSLITSFIEVSRGIRKAP